MTTAYSIVNAPNLYVNGLQMSGITGANLFTVAPGAARDSTNNNDIILDAPVQLNTLLKGITGIDTGQVPTGNRVYSVYLLGDDTRYHAATLIMSLDPVKPLLPLGYNMWRRIGAVPVQVGGNTFAANQMGNSDVRKINYVTGVQVMTNFTALVSTTVSLVTAAPLFNTTIDLAIDIASSVEANSVALGGGPAGSASPIIFGQTSTGVTTNRIRSLIQVPSLVESSIPSIHATVALTGGVVNGYVLGYTDYL